MADEDDVLPSGLFQRPGDAFRTAADIVDAGEVRMLAEQGLGLPVVLGLVVMAFAQADDLDVRIELLEQMQEAHLALLMGAIAQAAGDHRHLGPARPDESGDELAGGAPGGAVVEADIGGAGRVGDVGDQRDAGDAALGERIDRLAHGRMLQRHEGDAVDLAADAPELMGEQLRLEALDMLDPCAHVEGSELVLRSRDQPAEQAEEAVVPGRQQEAEPQGPERARRQRPLHDIAELARRLQHALDGRRPHAGALVEHPVDRRGRDARQACDVLDPRHLAAARQGVLRVGVLDLRIHSIKNHQKMSLKTIRGDFYAERQALKSDQIASGSPGRTS